MNRFDKTSDHLAAARDEMATRGQTRIRDFGPDGTVCVRGALWAALGFNDKPQRGDDARKAIEPAWDALIRAIGGRGILSTPMAFNARYDLNECLDLFHEAQILAKEAGD